MVSLATSYAHKANSFGTKTVRIFTIPAYAQRLSTRKSQLPLQDKYISMAIVPNFSQSNDQKWATENPLHVDGE